MTEHYSSQTPQVEPLVATTLPVIGDLIIELARLREVADTASTLDEFDKLTTQESAILGQIALLELAEDHIVIDLRDSKTENDVNKADPMILELFGSEIESLPDVKQARVITANDSSGTVICDKDLRKISAFDATHPSTDRKQSDIKTKYDSFEFDIETEKGLGVKRVRIVDLTQHMTKAAQEPFVAEKAQARKFKQRALFEVFNTTRLAASENFVFGGRVKTVTALGDVHYIQDGKKRTYFMVVQGDAKQSVDNDAVIERTIVYLGTCTKNLEKDLYRSVFNIEMK